MIMRHEISCPVCSVIVSCEDIRAWSAPGFFARYERISVQRAIQDGLAFCWCAIPECQSGYLCDPERES